MPTLEEVKKMVSDLGKEVDTFGTKKEINYLPQILSEDEKIIYLTSGLMNNNTWLITCTNKRVIFLDKGMIYGLKQCETSLEKINSIEQKTGLIFGEISIWDGSSKMTIKNVMKRTVKPFVDAVNKAIENKKNNSQGNKTSQPVDFVLQLEKLAELKNKGIITEEEFQIKKKECLNL
jgi:hypothetical protein